MPLSTTSGVARHQALPFTPMKLVIRTFFKTLRVVLGPVMLLKERLTNPEGVQRDAAAQAAVDLQCQSLALYQFSTCPFCIKVAKKCAACRCQLKSVMRNTTLPTVKNFFKAAALPKCLA